MCQRCQGERGARKLIYFHEIKKLEDLKLLVTYAFTLRVKKQKQLRSVVTALGTGYIPLLCVIFSIINCLKSNYSE